MLPIRRNISSLHFLILGYLVALAVLVLMIAQVGDNDESDLALAQAVVDKQGDGLSLLVLSGESFHQNVRGVLVDNRVNEESQLWSYLPNLPAHSLDVVGNRAFVACSGNKIISVDIDSGEGPEPLSSIDMPGRVSHIRVVGDQALVGMFQHGGMALVELSASGEIKLKEHYTGTGVIGDMVLVGEVVYYSDLSRGIGRFDFSVENPHPEFLAAVKSPWRMASSGRKLVVGTVDGKLHLFEVADDSSLTEVGGGDFGTNIRGTVIIEDTLAVAFDDGNMRMFSLSLWPQLTERAVLALPGRSLLLRRVPGRSWVVASLVANGFALIDLSHPEDPVLLGHVGLSRTFKQILPQPERILAVGHNGFESFSIDKIIKANPLEGVLSKDRHNLLLWNGQLWGYRNKEMTPFPEVPVNPVAASEKFTVSPDEDGLSLFSMGQNGQAVRAGSVPMIDGAEAVIWQNHRLYVVDSQTFYLWSGDRPEALTLVAEMRLPGQLRSMELLDSKYLLISSVDNGLYVIDIEDASHPRQVAALPLPKHFRMSRFGSDLLVHGEYVFVSQGLGGVHVVDLSLPEEPKLLQVIDTPGHAKMMALYDDFLLVGDGSEGVYLIDVSDPTACLAVGSLPTPLRAEQLVVAGDSMIISSHPGGTMSLPLPQRLENLRIVNQGKAEATLLPTFEKSRKFTYLYDSKGSVKARVK